MRLIRGIHNLHTAQRGGVATIGNFDGVHQGHRRVIERVIQLARQEQTAATVISFEPLPHEYFNPEAGPTRLSSLREKYQQLAQTGLDQLLILPFNAKLAQQSAEAFCQQVLQQGLGLAHLIVGDDFRFGYQRQGDYAFLQEFAKRSLMQVEPTQTHRLQGARISSTRIRAHLAEHQLPAAEALLGRAYCFNARVAHGDKLGRTLGYPTINLLHKRQRLPVAGAFVVRCTLANGQSHFGMANAGLRPTVNGLSPRLEAHLFDTEQDLYGQHVSLTLLAHLRPELKFASIEALQQQLAQDEAKARALISQHSWAEKAL